jgi:hypothetical protein
MTQQIPKPLVRKKRDLGSDDLSLFKKKNKTENEEQKSNIEKLVAEIAGNHSHQKRVEQQVVDNNQIVNDFRQTSGE